MYLKIKCIFLCCLCLLIFTRCSEYELIVIECKSESIPILLFGGQSNVSSAGAKIRDMSPDYKRKYVDMLYTSNNSPIQPLNYNNHTNNNFGPEVALARAFENEYTQYLFAKFSVGGTGLDNDPENPDFNINSNEEYTNMVNYYKEVMDQIIEIGCIPEVKGFIWVHGERDSNDEITAANYEQNLIDMLHQLRIDLSLPDLPIIVTQLPHYLGNARRDLIRQSQFNAVDSVGNAHYILDDNWSPIDAVHLNASSVENMSEQMIPIVESF